MTSSGPASGASRPHESARAQVAGTATYVDDIPEVKGTLHAAPILSTVAHGRLLDVDTVAALAMPGVHGVVLARDIPGDPVLATFVHDEPVFARDKVEHVGQVIGVVVADTVMQARRAARKVQLKIAPLAAGAVAARSACEESYVLPPVTVRRGEPEAALARSRHTLEGQLEVGGQEHFYLEGQVAYALPLEQDQWWIHSSTQHPGEVQHWVAHALGLENNAVTVECRRMGGGFGGKETQAGHMAVWAALAARKFKRPVKLRLDRDDDFMITGKRHPFAYDWRVGFDDSGLVTGLKLTMLADCGFSADLSGPGGRPRGLPHRQRLFPVGRRDRVVSLQDQHPEPHRVPRLRRPAGRDRDRGHPGRHRAASRPGPARRAPAQPVRRGRSQRHPLPDEGGGQHPAAADGAAGANLQLPTAARSHRQRGMRPAR